MLCLLNSTLSISTCTRPRGGGGGGVLRYFHTYVGSGYFLGFKILNFNIFLGFQKNEYFLGGSSQNWASLRVISIQFRVFF